MQSQNLLNDRLHLKWIIGALPTPNDINQAKEKEL